MLLLYAIPLFAPLVLIMAGPLAASLTFAALSLALLVQNGRTIYQLLRIPRGQRFKALVGNEIIGTLLAIALVTLPWVIGGFPPSHEALAVRLRIPAFTASAAAPPSGSRRETATVTRTRPSTRTPRCTHTDAQCPGSDRADHVAASDHIALDEGGDHGLVARDDTAAVVDREHWAVHDDAREVHHARSGRVERARGRADVDAAVTGRVWRRRRDERPRDGSRRVDRPSPGAVAGRGGRWPRTEGQQRGQQHGERRTRGGWDGSGRPRIHCGAHGRSAAGLRGTAWGVGSRAAVWRSRGILRSILDAATLVPASVAKPVTTRAIRPLLPFGLPRGSGRMPGTRFRAIRRRKDN